VFVPYNVDVPMDRWPIANWALIALTCVVSVYVWTGAETEWVLSYMVLQRDEDFSAWQLVGSLFTHGGILHLAGNMFFLFVFGNALNARLGHLFYIAAYLLVGVLGGLAWLALGDGPAVIGASGAIMGMIGAFLVYYPRNEVSIFYWWGLAYTGTFDLSAYWVVAGYFAFDLWGLARSGDASGVAYLCHVAGAVLGFGIASTLVLTGLVKPGEGEQTLFQAVAQGRRKKPRAAKVNAPLLRPPPTPLKSEELGSIPLVGHEQKPANRPVIKPSAPATPKSRPRS
jgi:membrane associated rhomboid family serine protease